MPDIESILIYAGGQVELRE